MVIFDYLKKKREMLGLDIETVSELTGFEIEKIQSFETDTLPSEEEMLLLAPAYKIPKYIANRFIKSVIKEKFHKPISKWGNASFNNYCVTPSQLSRKEIPEKHLENASRLRNDLIALINSNIKLRCEKFTLYCNPKYKKFDRILLTKPTIIKTSACRNVPVPFKLDHMWITVDVEWKNRAPEHLTCDLLEIKAMVYEYESDGKRNIGMQAFYIRPKNYEDIEPKLQKIDNIKIIAFPK